MSGKERMTNALRESLYTGTLRNTYAADRTVMAAQQCRQHWWQRPYMLLVCCLVLIVAAGPAVARNRRMRSNRQHNTCSCQHKTRNNASGGCTACALSQHATLVSSNPEWQNTSRFGVRMASRSRSIHGVRTPEVVVTQVRSGSAAEKAGITTGDVITSVDDVAATSPMQTRSLILKQDSPRVAFSHNGKQQSSEVTLDRGNQVTVAHGRIPPTPPIVESAPVLDNQPATADKKQAPVLPNEPAQKTAPAIPSNWPEQRPNQATEQPAAETPPANPSSLFQDQSETDKK